MFVIVVAKLGLRLDSFLVPKKNAPQDTLLGISRRTLFFFFFSFNTPRIVDNPVAIYNTLKFPPSLPTHESYNLPPLPHPPPPHAIPLTHCEPPPLIPGGLGI